MGFFDISGGSLTNPFSAFRSERRDERVDTDWQRFHGQQLDATRQQMVTDLKGIKMPDYSNIQNQALQNAPQKIGQTPNLSQYLNAYGGTGINMPQTQQLQQQQPGQYNYQTIQNQQMPGAAPTAGTFNAPNYNFNAGQVGAGGGETNPLRQALSNATALGDTSQYQTAEQMNQELFKGVLGKLQKGKQAGYGPDDIEKAQRRGQEVDPVRSAGEQAKRNMQDRLSIQGLSGGLGEQQAMQLDRDMRGEVANINARLNVRFNEEAKMDEQQTIDNAGKVINNALQIGDRVTAERYRNHVQELNNAKDLVSANFQERESYMNTERANFDRNVTQGQFDQQQRDNMFQQFQTESQLANDAFDIKKRLAMDTYAMNFQTLSENNRLEEQKKKFGDADFDRMTDIRVRNNTLMQNTYNNLLSLSKEEFDQASTTIRQNADLEQKEYENYMKKLEYNTGADRQVIEDLIFFKEQEIRERMFEYDKVIQIYNQQASGLQDKIDAIQYNRVARREDAAVALNTFSSIFGGAMGSSDIRLKENIIQVGELMEGIKLYTFNFIGKAIKQVGVMAQEVEKLFPECVSNDIDGYKRVNYGLLLELV